VPFTHDWPPLRPLTEKAEVEHELEYVKQTWRRTKSTSGLDGSSTKYNAVTGKVEYWIEPVRFRELRGPYI